jgi:hypothetical protein
VWTALDSGNQFLEELVRKGKLQIASSETFPQTFCFATVEALLFFLRSP